MIIEDQQLLTYPGIRHGFCTREDDNNLLPKLGLDSARLISLTQVHSNFVVTADDKSASKIAEPADALVTRHENIALAIYTADCAPILFFDPVKRIIGAAHAGWKGARDGIAENTLRVMHSLGSTIGDIRAAIGPCIHQNSYEVRQDFYDSLAKSHSGAEAFFKKTHKEGQYHFNLPGYVMHRLAKYGVNYINHSPHDTYAEESLFDSYRRSTQKGEKHCGRMVSIIALT